MFRCPLIGIVQGHVIQVTFNLTVNMISWWGDYTELKLLVSGIIEAYVQANINQIYRTWQVNIVQNNMKNTFLPQRIHVHDDLLRID